MEIVDNITGELIVTATRYRAVKLANDRLKRHNSVFTYGRYGKHDSCNATMQIKDDVIVIDYKKEN